MKAAFEATTARSASLSFCNMSAASNGLGGGQPEFGDKGCEKTQEVVRLVDSECLEGGKRCGQFAFAKFSNTARHNTTSATPRRTRFIPDPFAAQTSFGCKHNNQFGLSQVLKNNFDPNIAGS